MKRAILVSVVAALACGDDGRNPMVGDDGGGVDARTLIDSGMVASDGAVDPLGPTIEITSPTAPASGDFSSDALLTEPTFQVLCDVSPNATSGELVDPTSVVIDAIGPNASVQAPASATGQPNQFAAILGLSTFENGAVTLRCTASDIAMEPRTTSAEIGTFFDQGPAINIANPLSQASYGGAVVLSLTVLPDPVDAADTGAGIGSVTATVGGVPVTLDNPTTGVYNATVAFDNPAFEPPLDGEIAVVVTASNSRTSTAVARFEQVNFIADNDGPSVSIGAPAAGELVSGFINITASVTDMAGVQTVTATVDEFEVPLINSGGDSWSAFFDTRLLDGVYPLIVVRALDLVGNEASVGQVIALDNAPPILDLDSVSVREATCVNTSANCGPDDDYECTKIFDPLGTDSVDDGETVLQLSELRVRAEDRANIATSTSGVGVPIANVDPASVHILVLDDVSTPLLVDTTGDGKCDSINPDVEPAVVPQGPGEAASVQLASVAISGTGWGGFWATGVGVTTGLGDDACYEPIADAPEPPDLCIYSDTKRQVSTSYDKGVAAIFGIPPITTDSCNGNAFDSVASNISDGWACIAAVASDNLGNTYVSPPLRVCFDGDDDGEDDNDDPLADQDCAPKGEVADLIDRPDCTLACTPVGFADFPGRNILYRETDTRQCADGQDNDGDLLVDEADTDGCDAPNDNDEEDPPPP